MSVSMGVPQEAIFGLLVCVAALGKILYFALYLLWHWWKGSGASTIKLVKSTQVRKHNCRSLMSKVAFHLAEN